MISNAVTSLRILLLIPIYALVVYAPGDAGRWASLAVFLAAGLTDVLDGFLARRLNETSAFGAMLDLIADRLLTAVTLTALVVGGRLAGAGAVAALVLVVRDLLVASFNEALPGRLAIRVSLLERVKITFHFVAVGLLLAPEIVRPAPSLGQHDLGAMLLTVSAVLAVVTLVDYSSRTHRAFAADRG